MPLKKNKNQVLSEIKHRNTKYPPIHPIDDTFEYTGTNQKIEWKCERNHVFNTTFKIILKGHGCKICGMQVVGNKNIKPINELHRLLQERNKKLPSKIVKIKDISQYHGMSKQLTWICDNGHEWSATPKTVISGSYCRKCADIKNANNQRLSNENILTKIDKHNSEYPNKIVDIDDDLSKYKNNKSIIKFKCTNNHIWTTQLGNIIDAHAGCPICTQAGFSLKAIEWLDTIIKTDNIKIQHALNGGEYNIPNSRYRADGYCLETNTIYEFHGDIFHGNPLIFNMDDKSPIDKKTYGELHKQTLKKEEFIQSQGYNLVVIWEETYDNIQKYNKEITQIADFFKKHNCSIIYNTEYDLYLSDFNIGINYVSLQLHTIDKQQDIQYNKKQHTNATNNGDRLITIFSHEWQYNKDKVKDSLGYFIGVAKRGVGARKVSIKQISWVESKNFLNKYHLLNSGAPVSFSLGGFDGQTLIAVMTFGKPAREQGKADYYEMTRFVTDKKTHPGLATKMFKHAIKEYKLTKVIAFVDKRWFSGVFKTIAGFTVVSETKPSMWYTDGKQLFNRRFITKQALINKTNLSTELTKDIILSYFGYNRIYDCGKYKLLWVSNDK